MTKPAYLSVFALAVTLGAARAVAQAPAQTPPPPRPAAAQAPPALRPQSAPPPPAPVPSPAVRRPAVFAELRPPSRPGLPPDSARPARAPATPLPPSNAVAQCSDGSFIVAPSSASACGSHGGVRAVLPNRVVLAPPVVTRAALAAAPPPPVAAPPAGATMRCKDGTFLTGAPAAYRCDANGGLAAILPAPRRAPPPARPHRP